MRGPTTAMVLAAGLGTRLRPLTDRRAKPALPVAGEPLIRRIIAWLAGWGITDAVLNLHHRPDTIAAVLGDGSDLGVRVRYSWELPLLLGSAGGPRLALPILGVDAFWLINGDTIAEVNLAALADEHARNGARVTLAVVPHPDPQAYGGVRVDDQGRVCAFTRRGAQAAGTWHFTGVQLVAADVFAPVPTNQPSSTIGGIYDVAIHRTPGAVSAFKSDAAFHDIGTPIDYLAASRAFASSAHGGEWLGRDVHVHPTAALHETIVWNGVWIGEDARLDRCIVTDGVVVPAGAVYSRAILLAAEDGGLRAEPF